MTPRHRLLLIALTLAGTSLFAMGKKELTGIPVEPGHEIIINAEAASVTLQSWDKPRLGVWIDRNTSIDQGELKDAISLTTSETGATACAISRVMGGKRPTYTILVPRTAIVSVTADEICVNAGNFALRRMQARWISLHSCGLTEELDLEADEAAIRETRIERKAVIRAMIVSVRDARAFAGLTIADSGKASPFTLSLRNVAAEGTASEVTVEPQTATVASIEIREEGENGNAPITIRTGIASGSILVRSDFPVKLTNLSSLAVITRDSRWEPTGKADGTTVAEGAK